jgi:hypothetical protein
LFLIGGFGKLENSASKYILVKQSPLWKKKKKKKRKKREGGREREREREIHVNVSYLSMPLFHNSLLQI